MAVVSVAVLLLWRNRAGARRTDRFYALFACAVTLSVQLVGVYLVFASLILPALATRRLAGAGAFCWLGYGTSAYIVGLSCRRDRSALGRGVLTMACSRPCGAGDGRFARTAARRPDYQRPLPSCIRGAQ